MADLNESINAVTCGSLQMVEGFVPAGTVTPGAGVTAPGVSETGVGLAMNKVEVGNASRVGVGGGTVLAGMVHPASNANPIKSMDRVLVFILISSFDNYIPPIYLQRGL
jgi:hypothetical protein